MAKSIEDVTDRIVAEGQDDRALDDVALRRFRLFFHTSWIDSRNEESSYLGNGLWNVTASLVVNRARLGQICLGREAADDAPTQEELESLGTVRVPLAELDKNNRNAAVIITDRNGALLPIPSVEICAYYAWLILIGCIIHSRDVLKIPRKTGIDFMSKELGDLVWSEICAYRPTLNYQAHPHGVTGAFLDRLKGHDKATNGSLYDEMATLVKEVPGFASLFELFVLNWVPVVDVVPGADDCGVLVARYTDYGANFDAEMPSVPEGTPSKDDGEKRLPFADRFMRWRGGGEITYALRRIGTAEGETFVLNMPPDVLLSAIPPTVNGVSASVPIVLEDLCSLYDREEGAQGKGDDSVKQVASDGEVEESSDALPQDGKSDESEPSGTGLEVECFGTLTESNLSVKTNMIWDAEACSPMRRFAIPEQPESKEPAPFKEAKRYHGGWYEYVMEHQHTYRIRFRVRAKSGKRSKAYRAFFLTSLVALAFAAFMLALKPCSAFGIGGDLLTSLCVLVPLLALVYSNLQDDLPFYRWYLLRDPLQWVRWGIVADAVSFGALMVAFLFGSVAAVRWIVFAVALVAAIAQLVLLILMQLWLRHNDDHKGQNKLMCRDSMNTLWSIEPTRLKRANPGEAHTTSR